VPRLPEVASRVPRAVRARRPNHVWMVDLTDVKGMFGLVTFKVGVVFDAFSRMSDRGACFTGGVFRRKLRRLGVKQRFGAIGKKGSIALIERFWRTLKDTLGLRLLRPSVAEDLLEKIELGLVHYAHLRPNQALGGATPAEIYFGRTPAHHSAIPPPRGRPGESPMDSPFRIEYLDAERLLPVLVRKAA
jgi:transposase InsO family protein